VIGAVCDSPFANFSEIVFNVMSNLNIPTNFIRNFLFNKIQNGFIKRTEIDINSINPEDNVDNIKNQSIFFIHGDNDTLIPIGHTFRLY